jgi:hypothetical protein
VRKLFGSLVLGIVTAAVVSAPVWAKETIYSEGDLPNYVEGHTNSESVANINLGEPVFRDVLEESSTGDSAKTKFYIIFNNKISVGVTDTGNDSFRVWAKNNPQTPIDLANSIDQVLYIVRVLREDGAIQADRVVSFENVLPGFEQYESFNYPDWQRVILYGFQAYDEEGSFRQLEYQYIYDRDKGEL